MLSFFAVIIPRELADRRLFTPRNVNPTSTNTNLIPHQAIPIDPVSVITG